MSNKREEMFYQKTICFCSCQTNERYTRAMPDTKQEIAYF